MGFFQDLKEDLSQAVSEFTGEDKFKEEVAEEKIEDKNEDLFAAAEESLGIEYNGDADDSKMEAALGAFIDQVAANAELAQERYDAAANAGYEKKYEPEPAYKNYSASESEYLFESSFDRPSQEEIAVELPVSDEVAVITKNMVVNGDMISIGSLEVMGIVNGNIKVNGELNVSGVINGNSEAANIIMTNSNVTGDVVSAGALKIGSKSVVRGNIYATSAVIAGAIKGDIDVHGPVILDSTAIVKGNIKSKAVQINNGAAVEGMCSQCYAEVSPSAFFGD